MHMLRTCIFLFLEPSDPGVVGSAFYKPLLLSELRQKSVLIPSASAQFPRAKNLLFRPLPGFVVFEIPAPFTDDRVVRWYRTGGRLLPCYAHEVHVHAPSVEVHQHDVVVAEPLLRVKLEGGAFHRPPKRKGRHRAPPGEANLSVKKGDKDLSNGDDDLLNFFDIKNPCLCPPGLLNILTSSINGHIVLCALKKINTFLLAES